MSEKIKKQAKGVAGLLCSLFVIWSLTFYILPTISGSFHSFKTLADFIDESEIDTGQFYYTDVEIVTHADIGARSTIEYFSGKR